MKKTILTIAAVAFFFAVQAQTAKTYNWPDGTKKAEGMVIGEGAADETMTKTEAARRPAEIRDGKWTTWHQNGKIRSEENYDKGRMTGNWKAWYENGQLESEFDFTSGNAVFYFQDGQKHSEGKILDGMFHTGSWTGYYQSGKKNYEGSYNEKGLKIGTWKWYDEAGKVVEQQFVNGELVVSGK